MNLTRRLGLFLCISIYISLAQITHGGELVTNGNFEAGNIGFTSMYSFGNNSPPATYTVGNNPSTAPGHYADWASFGDHTSGLGLMMIVNGGTDSTMPFWSETVPVIAGQTYFYSFFGATINTTSASPGSLQLEINGTPIGSPLVLPTTGGTFVQASGSYVATSGSATLALVDLNTAVALNDFVVDDISFSGPTSNLEMNGFGTLVFSNGKTATFNIQDVETEMKNNGFFQGAFGYNDARNHELFATAQITSVTFSGNQATFSGNAKDGINRNRNVTFTVAVLANQGTGNDTLTISVSDGYSATGKCLNGGIFIAPNP
jgi:hypothetical protein